MNRMLPPISLGIAEDKAKEVITETIKTQVEELKTKKPAKTRTKKGGTKNEKKGSK